MNNAPNCMSYLKKDCIVKWPNINTNFKIGSYFNNTLPYFGYIDEAQYVELTATKSRLLNRRNIRSSNFQPGREIEYVNVIGKITKTRMFVAHGRLYKVMAIVSKKQHDTLNKTITGYLNSFQLVLSP